MKVTYILPPRTTRAVLEYLSQRDGSVGFTAIDDDVFYSFADDNMLSRLLDEMVKAELLEDFRGRYLITEKGREYIALPAR